MCAYAEARLQKSAADARRELEAREEARNNVKLVWRALAALASGLILDSVYPMLLLHHIIAL